jgi:hypothetical protein
MRAAPKKKAPETAATASRAHSVVIAKPTTNHSAPDRSGNSPTEKETAAADIGQAFFECRKPGGYLLRAQFEKQGTTTFLDVRVWSEHPDGLRPTKKGATIPLGRVRELGEALCRVNLPGASEEPESDS